MKVSFNYHVEVYDLVFTKLTGLCLETSVISKKDKTYKVLLHASSKYLYLFEMSGKFEANQVRGAIHIENFSQRFKHSNFQKFSFTTYLDLLKN